MNNYSILNSKRMKEQSNSAIESLKQLNNELSVLQRAYLNISEDSVLQGKTADYLRDRMSEYYDVVESMIILNDLDISNHKRVMEELDDEFYDGGIINQEKNNACIALQTDTEERDKWQTLFTEAKSVHAMIMAEWYSNEVKEDEKEIQLWTAKEERFDEINDATASLFTVSETIREMIDNKIKSLSVDLSKEYNSVLPKTNLREDVMKIISDDVIKYFDNGLTRYNADYIYDYLKRIDELTDTEYDGIMTVVQTMISGLVIEKDATKAEAMESIYKRLEELSIDACLD